MAGLQLIGPVLFLFKTYFFSLQLSRSAPYNSRRQWTATRPFLPSSQLGHIYLFILKVREKKD